MSKRFDVFVNGEWYLSVDTMDELNNFNFDGFAEVIDNEEKGEE